MFDELRKWCGVEVELGFSKKGLEGFVVVIIIPGSPLLILDSIVATVLNVTIVRVVLIIPVIKI